MILDPSQTSNGKTINVDSTFGYTPPAVEDTSADFAATEAQSIADIAAEFADAEAAPYLDPDAPDEEVEDAPQEDDGDVLAPIEGKDEEEPADPKKDRYFERVVQRELAAKEAESKAEARLKVAEAKEAEYRGLEGLKSTKQLQEQLAIDPWGALKSMGQDPATIIRLALAQEMLAKGPPSDPNQLKSYNELKEFADKTESKRELAAIRAELAQEKQATAAREYFNTVQSQAREYVTSKVGDSTPTLALVKKADPDTAFSEVWEEITKDAANRAAKDPSGAPLSFEQAAKNVEARLAKWQKLLVQNSTQAPTQGKKPNVTPPQAQPPKRPLRPWESSHAALEEQGLNDALREFHRVEAASKQRR